MGRNKVKCPILKLPSEMITTILEYTDIEDIFSFGGTCKYFNDMIKNSQMLWKIKFKMLVPPEIFFKVERDYDDVNWFDQVNEFNSVKLKVHNEVLAMSPKHFWQNNNITLQDVRRFFDICLTNNMTYYFTVYLLQELVTNGARNTRLWEGHLPYTLTEMHYSKVVLCHLMHSFLAVKWAQGYTKEELLPKVVLTFFLQWIDVTNLYMQYEVDQEIDNVVCDVEMLLLPGKRKTTTPGEIVRKHLAENKLKERNVIDGISQIIYQCRRIEVTTTMDIETLSIPEILKRKSGHMIAVASIFQAVAHQCGIKCDVIAFPNHFFLEWRCNDNEQRPQVYKIDIASGEVQETRRCPFSAVPTNSSCVYCPNSLLRHIITTFTRAVDRGNLGSNNWYRQNAFLLFELLNPEAARDSPYYNYLRYLTHDAPLDSLSSIDLEFNVLLNTFLKIRLDLIRTKASEWAI